MNFGESLGLHKLLLNKTHLILWWDQETWFVEVSSLPGLYFWMILKRSRFSREIIEAAWSKNTLTDVACVCFFFKSSFLSFSLMTSWCHLDPTGSVTEWMLRTRAVCSAGQKGRLDLSLTFLSCSRAGWVIECCTQREHCASSEVPQSSLGSVPSTCPQPWVFRAELSSFLYFPNTDEYVLWARHCQRAWGYKKVNPADGYYREKGQDKSKYKAN